MEMILLACQGPSCSVTLRHAPFFQLAPDREEALDEHSLVLVALIFHSFRGSGKGRRSSCLW